MEQGRRGSREERRLRESGGAHCRPRIRRACRFGNRGASGAAPTIPVGRRRSRSGQTGVQRGFKERSSDFVGVPVASTLTLTMPLKVKSSAVPAAFMLDL